MKIIRPSTLSDVGAFTRATTGTYFDSAGVLQTAAIDSPRFNYNSENLLAGPSLLIEPAATNLLLQSSAFDNAAWVKTANYFVTANAGAAPDGSNNAELIGPAVGIGAFTTAAPTQVISKAASAITYTLTAFVKAVGSTTSVRLSPFSGSDSATVLFDLTPPSSGGSGNILSPAGVVGAFTGASSVKAQWISSCNMWRVNLTFTTTTSSNLSLRFFPYVGPTQLIGDGTSGILIWGAQLETGSNVTSYIPTTTVAVTRAADVNTAILVSNVPENDYPVWSAGTTYALNDRVILLSTHKIYQSAAAGNIGHSPPDITYWAEVGSTNRWRMFDQSVTSQTTQTGSIIVALTPGARIDSLVGLNIQAASATINVVDSTFGNVYSRQIQLTSTSGVTDWYSYFYEPIIQQTEFANLDLPTSYVGSTTTICFNGVTPAIGGLVIGLSKDLGISEWGAKIGIIDYSVKTKDNFGNYNIVQRNFSKRADFSVKVDTNTVDDLQNILSQYRATPIVYIGSNFGAAQQFNSTIIYGYYKEWSVDIAYATVSTLTLTVEGLN